MLTEELIAHCKSWWRDWFAEPTPRRVDLMFLPSRARSGERTTALVFTAGELRAVLKITRGAPGSLRREERVLRQLQADPALARLVPEVLGAGCEPLESACTPQATTYLLPVSAVGGRLWRPPDASAALTNREFGRVEAVLRDLDAITTRLRRVSASMEAPSLGVSWRDGLVTLGLDRSWRRRLEDYYPEDDGPCGRTGWCHGDLAPGNVRVSGSEVRAILDWELCDDTYEPWFDRLYPALLAISSTLAENAVVPQSSWPSRWLSALSAGSGPIPLPVRCLRATAELANRGTRLRRGDPTRWRHVESYLRNQSPVRRPR